jgi:GT2 family glycosyltransferase
VNLPAAPAVDVVVPCYNGARYLGETLDAALAQTHRPLRVLVVDDGSTDGTRQVVERYGGRVDYVFKENGGQASARNLGIGRTHGEYLLLLDADDLVAPGMVARMVERLEARPEADLAHCPPLAFLGRDQAHPMAEHWRPDAAWIDYLAPLSILCAIHGSATVFRRRAFERFGLFPESRAIQGCEDWHFWLQAVTQGAIVEHVPEALCLYRRHLGSSSASRTGIARRETEMMSRAATLFERHGVRAEDPRAVLAAGIASVAGRWLALGELGAYRDLLQLAARVNAGFHDREIAPLAAFDAPAQAPVLQARLSHALLGLGPATLAAVLFLRCRSYRGLRAQARRDGALDALERVVEVMERLVADEDEAARPTPSYTAYLAVALGVMEGEAGDRGAARARFEQALRLDPGNVEAALRLAVADLKRGRLVGAATRAAGLGRRRRALAPSELATWMWRRVRGTAVSPVRPPSPPPRPGDPPA